MDHALQHHKSYIGRPASELPTPSLVIRLPVLRRNIDKLHQDVEKLGIGFRPHVKTLKCLEVTRMMLAGGKYRSIVASTLPEIRGALPLVEEGILDECLYGLPVYPGILPQLTELCKAIRIQLLIDNEQQLAILERSNPEKPWDVFIKLDVGSHRAGVTPDSPALHSLIRAAEACPAVRVYGIYCHANHSYGGRTRAEAEDTLRVELDSAVGAAKLLPGDREIVASVGATPTAHVVESLKAHVPANVKLELHAGNYPCNDLQQVSTGLVSETDQAGYVAAEVCGVYPERNEALVNAGVTALSRETSSAYPGFGVVVGRPGWGVVRMSQEHGILGLTRRSDGEESQQQQQEEEDRRAEDTFEVGQRVQLYCNHVCITAAAFHVYFVVDADDVVRETWIPWKGW